MGLKGGRLLWPGPRSAAPVMGQRLPQSWGSATIELKGITLAYRAEAQHGRVLQSLSHAGNAGTAFMWPWSSRWPAEDSKSTFPRGA
jgi:hypothetical protein